MSISNISNWILFEYKFTNSIFVHLNLHFIPMCTIVHSAPPTLPRQALMLICYQQMVFPFFYTALLPCHSILPMLFHSFFSLSPLFSLDTRMFRFSRHFTSKYSFSGTIQGYFSRTVRAKIKNKASLDSPYYADYHTFLSDFPWN